MRLCFGVVSLFALFVSGSFCATIAQTNREADLELLRTHKLPTDGAGLLKFFQDRTIKLTDEKQIAALIDQLGNEEFEKREEASHQLIQLGDRARKALKGALVHDDVEIIRRAEACLELIEKGAGARTIAAAARVLAMRKPDGATKALIGYIPSAEDDSVVDALQQALNVLALHDGKVDPLLLETLDDEQSLKRTLAGVAVARTKVKAHLPKVRKLLADPDPNVRLMIALALARVPDREAVAPLIELLDQMDIDQGALGRAENMLYRLAGADAPKLSRGNTLEARRKYREAWQAWYRAHKDFELTALEEATRTLGYTTVVLLDENRVLELDENNKIRTELKDIEFPLDVEVLPNDHVLLAEHGGGRVTERTPKGKIVWEKKVIEPLVAQRLPNGNTFIAFKQGLVEVTPQGKEVFTYARPGGETIMRARKLRNGNIALVTQLGVSRFVLLDEKGKELRSQGVNVTTSGGRIDLLPNGNVLIPELSSNRIVEYDPSGNLVWQANVTSPIVAYRLPNGHTLVTSMLTTVGAIEIDRAGKTVWQYKVPTRVTRAYRR